jgi:hypothetical protein
MQSSDPHKILTDHDFLLPPCILTVPHTHTQTHTRTQSNRKSILYCDCCRRWIRSRVQVRDLGGYTNSTYEVADRPRYQNSVHLPSIGNIP